ncbi:MAG: hypothetical protein U0931_22890 [Vulcanimicrobiota bacterium]
MKQLTGAESLLRRQSRGRCRCAVGTQAAAARTAEGMKQLTDLNRSYSANPKAAAAAVGTQAAAARTAEGLKQLTELNRALSSNPEAAAAAVATQAAAARTRGAETTDRAEPGLERQSRGRCCRRRHAGRRRAHG